MKAEMRRRWPDEPWVLRATGSSFTVTLASVGTDTSTVAAGVEVSTSAEGVLVLLDPLYQCSGLPVACILSHEFDVPSTSRPSFVTEQGT
ncbi:uncharacterized protein B0H18DRAFT_1043519 [Fomitopsis serialis]|uniref:uncharacterized protein n=1 Tax=Fomitopsis serialis TaxID=139415 RepID=UPI002008D9B1|nr:uncharacterized protein B0H18DRAFT_1043519 [Neoantrodia serialis]KAH9914975.1 hypothetical protein B0H18DRAFT_1043519 [Neoantrodia serialis]